MISETEKLDFKFDLILLNLTLNSHVRLLDTTLDIADLNDDKIIW